MKKVFSVLMVCAFAISASAQWLIYDYKVSIKRIDAQYTKVTYKIDEFDAKIPKNAGCKDYWTGYFDSFTTANDTLSGYIVIPACKPCGGDWQKFGSAGFTPATDANHDSFVVIANGTRDGEEGEDPVAEPEPIDDPTPVIIDPDPVPPVVAEPAYAYIQRKADKLYSNPMKAKFGAKSKTISATLTWKIAINIDAARFGKGAGSRLTALTIGNVNCTCAGWDQEPYATILARFAGTPTHTKPVKEAWMVLTYDVESYIGTEMNPYVIAADSSIIYPPVKNMGIDICTPTSLTYGLIGYQAKQGSISHAGFGKVTTTGTAGSTSVGFCGSVSVDPTSCTAVNTISGTIAGLFMMDGFCYLPPQWDICYYLAEDNNGMPSSKQVAPVCGNWSVKLNQSESKKYGSSFESAEARVLAKLKCNPFDTDKSELRKNFINDGTVDDYLY